MNRFFWSRTLQTIPTLIGVALVTFILLRLIPGDPTMMTGQTITEEVRSKLRAEWHLDDPLFKQFYFYMKGVPVLDFGRSFHRVGNPQVRDLIVEYFGRTLQLAIAAFFLSITLGISFGIIAALHKDSWIDRAVMMLALVGISMPVFVVGTFLILFAMAVGYRYISGTGGGDFDIHYLILPALTLGSRSIAYLARMTRASILEVSRADFLRTARAKGLNERTVVFKHLMKNAMIPIMTIIGLNFADFLTGAILTESVFQWPGIGFLIRNAINSRDIPVVMGTVLFTTFIFVMINFIVDLLYGFFDPRIRYS